MTNPFNENLDKNASSLHLHLIIFLYSFFRSVSALAFILLGKSQSSTADIVSQWDYDTLTEFNFISSYLSHSLQENWTNFFSLHIPCECVKSKYWGFSFKLYPEDLFRSVRLFILFKCLSTLLLRARVCFIFSFTLAKVV